MKSVMLIEPNRIYTREEVEQFLFTSRWTLSSYIKKGELNPISLSKKQIFLGEEILRFVKSKIKSTKE